MSKQGYITLHRSLLDNPLFNVKPFSKGQAWVTLLLLANHSKGYITVKNGELVEVNRGECGYSMVALADLFGWDRRTVKRFINLLIKEKMVQQKIIGNHSIINIINYEKYQDSTTKGTTDSTTNGTSISTINGTQTNNDNNVNNDKNVEEVEESNNYGSYYNVFLLNKDYQILRGLVMNDKILNEIIEDLSIKIATGKEQPYKNKLPHAHYERLKAYFKYRKDNPKCDKSSGGMSEERKKMFEELEKRFLTNG